MILPAEALPHEHAPIAMKTLAGDVFDANSDEIQAYVAPEQLQNAEIARTETYSVATLVDLASTVGISKLLKLGLR